MYFVPEGQHDRSQARSAWGDSAPQKSRPIGCGMIRARVRTDSKIGGGDFECAIAAKGIDACVRLGADVIVNTDADNKYDGHSGFRPFQE